MAKAKVSSGRKPRGRGNSITEPEVEAIYQTHLALRSKNGRPNISAVARSHGISRKTVYEVLQRFEASKKPEELVLIRENMDKAIQQRTYTVASQILDSIKPEDLESGRLPIYDAKGKLVGYKEFGPSIVAKATSFGILQDKIKIQRDLERAANTDITNGGLLMPDSVNQLIDAIKNRVQSLQVLNVNFKNDHEDLTTRIDHALQVEAEEVTVEPEPLDLYNP